MTAGNYNTGKPNYYYGEVFPAPNDKSIYLAVRDKILRNKKRIRMLLLFLLIVFQMSENMDGDGRKDAERGRTFEF